MVRELTTKHLFSGGVAARFADTLWGLVGMPHHPLRLRSSRKPEDAVFLIKCKGGAPHPTGASPLATEVRHCHNLTGETALAQCIELERPF
jgi:hypothetical protein